MRRIAILGAGVAGLSCAYLLQQQGLDVVVLEERPYAGGLARSFRWHDFDCDVATHRFYSSDEQVVRQILSLVPMDRCIRRSRLRLAGLWLHEPLNILELASSTLPSGPVEILTSYLTRSRQTSRNSFESLILEKYGQYLYHIFFQPYTERLFGLAGHDISIDWAHRKARLAHPLDSLRKNNKKNLANFYYPTQGGFGSIANILYESVIGDVQLNSRVIGWKVEDQRVVSVTYERGEQRIDLAVDYLISTLPLSTNVALAGHMAPLSYRALASVYLWIDKPRLTDYQWSYFIDAAFTINRLVEFKNMHPAADGTPSDTTVICAEVTAICPSVIEQVIDDLVRTGCIRREQILDAVVVMEKYAYPIYHQNYTSAVRCARQILDRFKNLKVIGRAAEFEHREVGDNFKQAGNVVNEILRDLAPIPIAD